MSSKFKIRNFTPHMINVYDGQSCIAGYPSEGNVRVEMSSTPVPTESTPCPIFVRQHVRVHGLPDAEPGTLLVVSAMVRAACPERGDLLSPGSGKQSLIRDSSGAVIGCRDFDAQPCVLTMHEPRPVLPDLRPPTDQQSDTGVEATGAPQQNDPAASIAPAHEPRPA